MLAKILLKYHFSVTSNGAILGTACQSSKFDGDVLTTAASLPHSPS